VALRDVLEPAHQSKATEEGQTKMRFILTIWILLAELPTAALRSILVFFGRLRLHACLRDEGYLVCVYEAGWPRKRGKLDAQPSTPRLVGFCLPATIILSTALFYPTPDSERNLVIAHELEHCRQWRRWSILFPLAYALAGLLALPRPYWHNRFEIAARAAVEKVKS
jgi:beta-lactamase regulating signal transducer with metallopeptidase domain